MPKKYNIKTDFMAPARVKKLCKETIDKIEIDIAHAMDTYYFFKDLVDNENNDGVSKQCMIDTLKAVKDLRLAAHKFMDMAIKAGEVDSSDGKEESFSIDTFLKEKNK